MFVFVHHCVIVLHGTILSYVVEEVIFETYTRFDHHSVSDPAINTNPFADIHHLITGVYPYCHAVIVELVIQANDLLAFGSSGILFIHAEIKFPEILASDHAVAGNDPLSI